MLSWWTLGRAVGAGAVAGILSLLFWPLERVWVIFALPLLPASVLADPEYVNTH